MGSKFDFGGYATKNDLLCSDGRTIRKDAFKDQDGQVVPLVWNHEHHSPEYVLGHALLENRDDGVYAYCTFNDTERGQISKSLVKHKDVVALSIYANKLKQAGSNVLHGAIREVSLVLAGANPGATIDSFVLEHGEYSDDEAIISMVPEDGYSNLDLDVLKHTVSMAEKQPEEQIEEPVEEIKEEQPKKKAAKKKEEIEMNNSLEHADSEKTVQDVFDELTEEQKTVVYALIGQAIEDAKNENNEGDKEDMKHSVFDTHHEDEGEILSHSDMAEILADATRGSGSSLKEAALAHGIDNIGILFPDAKAVTNTPEWIKRDDGWVSKVMNGTHHTPYSRIKSVFANITADEARARGYIKGNRKEEEVFTLLKRVTDPQTIYKKQAFDRDDVIDITDFDVVNWTKGEMRGMLNEEIARAVLVSDGRSPASNDKIKEDRIRPIWTDDDLYTIKSKVVVPAGSNDSVKAKAFIAAAIRARKDYKGSGNPSLFTTEDMLTSCLMIEDGIGRFLYKTEEELRTALRVKEIVTVPVMENLTRVVGVNTRYLMGIIVNLADYNIGADKGGNVSMFEDFDIDFNQHKYLIETRCSGALIKPFSAIALELEYGSFVLGAEGKSPDATVLGKSVADLQSNIDVTNSGITGTLKYVTGYTGYSGDPALQNGNFLALQFAAPQGATTTVEVLGGHSGPVTLDADMDAVVRIENKRSQKIKVVSRTAGGDVLEKVFDLSMLRLETE